LLGFIKSFRPALRSAAKKGPAPAQIRLGYWTLVGLKMKAYGLRGQGERVSQMLASRIPLAAERIADQKQRKSVLICVNQRLKILVPLCGYTKTFVFSVVTKIRVLRVIRD